MCKGIIALSGATKQLAELITSLYDVKGNKTFSLVTDGMEFETELINRMV